MVDASKKLKVAIIEPVGGHGGMNYYDIGLCKGLDESDVHVSLYTSEQTNVDSNYSFEINRVFKGVWGRDNKYLRAFRMLYQLLKTLMAIKRDNYDIVHYHFFHYTIMELIFVRFANVFKFDLVVTVHDVESFSGGNSKVNNIFSHVDRVIVHNNISYNEFLKKVNYAEKNIYIIPHGNYLPFIDDSRVTKESARKALGLENDNIVLFFGQIKGVKGLDVLLKSFKKVIEYCPNTKLLIAGKVWKDDWIYYQSLIDNDGLESFVLKRIQYIQDDEVSNYYKSADIIVLPYKEIYQSGVLLMAMSYGTPVIVSNIPGMTEIVSDLHNGFVFDTEDSNSLSEKIIFGLSNRDIMDNCSNVALDIMKDKFSWSRIGKLTSALYSSVVEK
jgi:D-inositol-3-phosphate glycosyltransferase